MTTEIANWSPDFAINGGDVTDYGWAGEFDAYRQVEESLPCPVGHVPGNHDVRWSPRGVTLFRQRLGEPYRFLEAGGVGIALLDSTVPLSHWGHYEREQLDELGGWLAQQGREKPLILATHHWVGRESVMIDNERALLDLLEPYNVQVLLTGHGHSDLHWDWEGLHCVMNRGLYQGSWMALELAGGTLRVARRTADQPTLQPVFERSIVAPRAKRPIWAIPAAVLAPGQPVPFDGELRWNSGPWNTDRVTPATPGVHTLGARRPGERAFYANVRVKGTSALQRRWTTPLDGACMSHVRLVDDDLVVSTLAGSVYCVAPESGKPRWRARTGGICHSTPLVLIDQIVVGSSDGSVYSFDRSTGKRRWRTKTGGPVWAGAALAGGVVVLASADGCIYGLAPGSGRVRWRYEMPPSHTAFAQSVAASDGTRAFIGAWDSHVYALEGRSGKLLWRVPCMERTFAFSPAIGSPCADAGRVYVPANGNGLFCLDAWTGAQRWMVASSADKYGHSSPRVHRGRVVVGGLGDAGLVLCVDAETGREVWTSRTGSVIYDSSPAVGDGWIAIGSVGSLLSVVRFSDGQLVAQERLEDGHFLSSPAARGDRLYTATFSNLLSGWQVRLD